MVLDSLASLAFGNARMCTVVRLDINHDGASIHADRSQVLVCVKRTIMSYDLFCKPMFK
jgi:hypothetical protein